MRFDGIIFDIDGTLWDSRRTVADAWNAALREQTSYGVQFEPEYIGSFFGRPMDEIFRTLLGDVVNNDMDDLIQTMYNYENHYLDMYPPSAYEGVYDTLKTLSREYGLYIVTNAQRGYTEKLFAATGICPFFRDWLCYGDTLSPKNVTLSRLAEKNGLKNPVYVGDTSTDADACAAAGIPMIYASYGFGTVEAPLARIGDIRELPGVLKTLE